MMVLGGVRSGPNSFKTPRFPFNLITVDISTTNWCRFSQTNKIKSYRDQIFLFSFVLLLFLNMLCIVLNVCVYFFSKPKQKSQRCRGISW